MIINIKRRSVLRQSTIMRNIASVIITLFVSVSVMGQFTITGNVIDELGNPLEFVNVILTDESDNIIEGDITEITGDFNFTQEAGNYKIKFSFVGFDDIIKEIQLDKDQKLENILLTESKSELGEVVVTSRRPTVIRKIDRLVFSIQNTTLSDSDAWEVLRKTPGVSVTSNGGIQIHGKPGVRVMINERPVQLSSEELKSMLEGLSANDIADIEVITNPSAKYGADGVGIINIKMIKRKDLGYGVNLRSKYTQAKYAKFSNGLTLNYKKEFFDLLASYNFDNGKRQSLEDTDVNFLDTNKEVTSSWDEAARIDNKYQSHNYRLAGNIYLSETSTLGLQATGSISPDRIEETEAETETTNKENVFNSLFTNQNDLFSDTKNTSYNLNYQKKLKKEGQKFNVDFDLTDYDRNERQTVSTNFYDGNRDFIDDATFNSTADQRIDIYSAKIDFTTPIDSASTFEVGAKYNTIKTVSDLSYMNLINDDYIYDPARSNEFVYDESTYATYVSYKRKFSDLLTLQAGLRGEYTETEGNSITLGEVNKNTQFNLFPTVFVKYRLPKNQSLGFTYGRRISRPQFALLNPFQFYTGAFSYIEGNPYLKPTMTHVYALNYSLKNKYYLKFFLYDSKNPITQLSIQDNESQQFKYLAVNLDKRLLGGLSFNTSFDIYSWWNIFIQTNYYYKKDSFQVPGTGEIVDNSRWNIYDLVLANSFYLAADISIDFEMTHRSARVQGGFNLEPVSEVSLGIKKKFLDKKGSVSVYVGDIFNQNIQVLNSEYGNQWHVFQEKAENQYVRLSLTYKFGNEKLKLRSQKTGTEKEKRRL